MPASCAMSPSLLAEISALPDLNSMLDFDSAAANGFNELYAAFDRVPTRADFDFAGIVNAPYAEPNPKYRLRHVRQRLYKGQCRNNDLLPGTIERFLDTRDAVYALINQLEPLSVESRKHLFRFLNLFYKRISDPKSVHRRFENKCQENP